MNRLLLGTGMCAILLVAATTRSDVGTADEPVDENSPLPEPITGTPALSPPTTPASAPKDPFAPYDVGPPESVWPYESLTPAERAVIDRGRDADGWRDIHDAYSSAVRQQSKRARAEAAQHILGIPATLDSTGVVP